MPQGVLSSENLPPAISSPLSRTNGCLENPYKQIQSFPVTVFVSRLTLVVFLALSIGCANVPPLQEQAALPPIPAYQPTSLPTTTLVPTTATPQATATLAALAPGRVASPTVTPTSLFTRTPLPPKTPKRDLAALNQYQRGVAYIALDRDAYRSQSSEQALDELFATGANYISLLVTWYQTDVTAKEIYRADNTPSDEDLAYVIAYAHARGIKVLLKPQVDFTQDQEHWRGQILFENEADWREWFASYRSFILYYARFAQANGVEEYSVGTELVATTKRTADWRALIRAVRQEYTGLLTYSANHSGEEVQVRFWNDLDFIGVNVFYHITNYRTPTLEQILEGWKLPVRQLTNLHNAFPDQPIIFTEVGYPSMDLANVWPWNWKRDGALDLEEQSLLYEGLFRTWWYNPEREWFRGMFIWNWLADPEQGGPGNLDYTPHGKPAEDVLKYYYKLQSPTRTTASE